MNATIKIWTRLKRPHCDEWILVDAENPTSVPTSVWKSFNKAFMRWKNGGYLWPLDEMDAYQIAAVEIIKTANRPLILTRATPSTYLIAAAYRTLMKYKERQVDPTRETYRRLADECRVDGNVDVRGFVESIGCDHDYATRLNEMRLAAVCVYDTLALLDADAQAGLRAFIDADGIWIDAAKRYGTSPQGYVYRFRHLWSPAFRRACTWVW